MAEEKKKHSSLRLRGLRQKWLMNTVMPVVALLAIIVMLFSAGVSNY